jgi:hypothetical protein
MQDLTQSVHAEKYDSIIHQRVDLKKGFLIGVMYLRPKEIRGRGVG